MADPTIVDFGELVRDRLEVVVGPALIGVYLHGSAALGGFRPGVSDVDLLVVVENPLQQPSVLGDVTRVLQESHESAPGRGIEASVILGEVARAGGHRLDFELHVCTDPNDPKVVDGAGHPGDPDLILHMAVCRQSAITVFGPNPAAVFAEVDLELVVGQMISELTWSLGHGSEAYAVLNACRARFYLETRMFCSKLDGGLWARDRCGASHLIDRSLAAQQGWGDDRPPSLRCETFVAAAISALTGELSDTSHD
jgi:streptomycin 3"-adenylyltransferase